MVVADTSPLNYLILIESVDVIQQLYRRICVPEAVVTELRSAAAPLRVQRWAGSPPPWVEVRAVSNEFLAEPRWRSLHRGEQAVLSLATQLKADLVLIDERAGVAVARRNGLRVSGTLGMIDEAARQGLLDLPNALQKLQATTFRYPQSLIAEMPAENAARRK